MTGIGALAAAAAAAVHGAAFDRFGHDPFDGSRAAAAPGTAAQANIDFSGAVRRFHLDYAAHVVLGDDVAGADDHGRSDRTVNIAVFSEKCLIGKRSVETGLYSSIDSREFTLLGSLRMRLGDLSSDEESVPGDGKSFQCNCL